MLQGAWPQAKPTTALQTRGERCQVRPKQPSHWGQMIAVSRLLQQRELPHITQVSAVSRAGVPRLLPLGHKTRWLWTSPLKTWSLKSTCRCLQATLSGSLQGGPGVGPRPHTHINITEGLFLLALLILNTRLSLFHPLVSSGRPTYAWQPTSAALHEECAGARGEKRWGRREGGFTDHEVESVVGNKAEILFLLLVRAVPKFTASVKAQGSLPCQRAQESCLILRRWQLLYHMDLCSAITHRELWRGLSCNKTPSKSTLFKVSVYNTQLGWGRDSFSLFWNHCKA